MRSKVESNFDSTGVIQMRRA